MRQFNVEFFDSEFNYLFNTSAGKVKYKEDYLDPEKAKITVNTTQDILTNYIIRMYRSGEEYSGIVTEAKVKDDGTTEVTFTSIENLLDLDILIDVAEISGTFEQYIKARIDEVYVTSPDFSQRIPMSVTAVTSTDEWEFDYEIENEPGEDEEPPVREVAFINILDDLIIPAFTKYGIVLECGFDFMAKQIKIEITKNTAAEISIEADLPNIIDRTVTIRKAKKRINKVNIWNSQDFERSTVYYLHPDDSFDTSDSDRVTPVKYKNEKVSADNNAKCISKKESELKSDYSKIKAYNKVDPGERTDEDREEAAGHLEDINLFMSFGWAFGSGDYIYDSGGVIVGNESWSEDDEFELAIEAWQETDEAAVYGEDTAFSLFTEKAYQKAFSTFSKNKYDNLIELEVTADDTMLNPTALKTGQIVNIISDGKSYSSILSGRETNDTITLIFGTIRLELTKTLKGRA